MHNKSRFCIVPIGLLVVGFDIAGDGDDACNVTINLGDPQLAAFNVMTEDIGVGIVFVPLQIARGAHQSDDLPYQSRQTVKVFCPGKSNQHKLIYAA